jgi:hypothetical protein
VEPEPLTVKRAATHVLFGIGGGVANIVLWVAHVYAHALSESLELQHRLGVRELLGVAQREVGIVLSAVAPTVVLLLGAAHVFTEATAIWFAFGVGLFTLAAEGVRYARFERVGPLGMIVAVALNLALGLALVALKVAVAH